MITLFGSSLQYCHKLPEVFEKLSLYSVKLYIGITTSGSFALSTCTLFISVMSSVNGPQLLSIACLLFLSVALAALSAPAPATVMFPLRSINALL